MLKVAVLYGGRSGEHEISIRSAESIIAALDPSKYEVKRVFITKEGRWQPGPILPEPDANPGIDVVFPFSTAPSARTVRCRACASSRDFPT